jgi:hypothetical protein
MPPFASGGRLVAWGAAIVALLIIAGVLLQRSQRSEEVWRNPLDGAKSTRLTDFDGAEHRAAITRDGKFVAAKATPYSSPSRMRKSDAKSILPGQASTITFPSGRTTARSSTSFTAWRFRDYGSPKATSGAFARAAASRSG